MAEKLLKMLHLKGGHRKLIMWYVNYVLAGTKPNSFEKKRKLLNSLDEFEIGEGTRIVGPIYCTGKLFIGNNCWVGKNFMVNGNGSVYIGDNCDVGPAVAFQTGGHEIGTTERRAGKGLVYNQSIGRGTWIGGRSTIIGSTTIGEGCIVAGCACVAKSFGSNLLIGGVPAKEIRKLG